LFSLNKSKTFPPILPPANAGYPRNIPEAGGGLKLHAKPVPPPTARRSACTVQSWGAAGGGLKLRGAGRSRVAVPWLGSSRPAASDAPPLPDKTELTDLTSGAGVVSVVSVNSRPRMPLVRPSAASGTSPKPRAGWLSAFAALEGFASNSAGLPLQRAGSSAFRI